LLNTHGPLRSAQRFPNRDIHRRPGSPQTVTQVAGQTFSDDTRIDTQPTDDIPRTSIGKLGLLPQRTQVSLFPDPSDDPTSAQPHEDRSTRISPCSYGERQGETGGGDGKGDAEKVRLRGREKVDEFADRERDEHRYGGGNQELYGESGRNKSARVTRGMIGQECAPIQRQTSDSAFRA